MINIEGIINIEGELEYYFGIVINCIALFLLAVVFGFAIRTFSHKNRNNRSFYLLFLMSCIEILTHLITTVLQGYWFLGSNQLGVVMYSFVFTVNCLYLFAWILYLSDRWKRVSASDFKYNKRVVFATLPILVLFILSIVNMFVPIFFSFVEFEYERKVLYDLNLLVPLGYLVYGGIKFLKSNRKRRMYQEIPFCELLLPIVLAHILEFVILGLCVIPLGNTITLLILVLNSVKQNASVDGLTGLYTRRELYNYLESLVQNKKNGKKIIGIIFDLDHFKEINDTYGHLVGDDALSDFGYILRNSIPHSAIGYRYAGDEFVIITNATTKEEADQIVDGLLDNLAGFNEKNERVYKLNTSHGSAILRDSDTIQEFIERMDHRMYEEKMEKRK